MASPEDPGVASAVSIPPPDCVPPSPAVPVPRQRQRRLDAWQWGKGVGAVVVLAVIVAGVLVVTSGSSSGLRGVAQEINLRASDLPGFTVQNSGSDAADHALDARMTACMGPGWIANEGRTDLADISSPQFVSGTGLQTELVSSDVTIARSAAAVRRDLALVNSGHIQSCFAQALDGVTVPTAHGPAVTIGSVQVTSLSVPVARSDGGFGMRATMVMSALGINVPVVLDILGYSVGRDELSLMALAIGHPSSAPTEQRLSTLLVNRALEHPH
jgi:hypothetical protein